MSRQQSTSSGGLLVFAKRRQFFPLSNVGTDHWQQLPLISHSLKITLNQTESHEFNDHACKALLTVINTCRDEITRLQEKLEKLAPSKRDSAWAKNFKALTSVFHDKEITSISANLSQSLAVINQYHGAYTAATTGTILRKLTAAVNAIPEEEHSQLNSIARHFMVPTILTDDFTGRGEAVDRLGNYMSSHSKHRRAAIVGLGCMGKPRLMLQYAYR
jgi:hypothetical protein